MIIGYTQYTRFLRDCHSCKSLYAGRQVSYDWRAPQSRYLDPPMPVSRQSGRWSDQTAGRRQIETYLGVNYSAATAIAASQLQRLRSSLRRLAPSIRPVYFSYLLDQRSVFAQSGVSRSTLTSRSCRTFLSRKKKKKKIDT